MAWVIFSYFYSNGAFVFTDDAYNSWKDKGGEYEVRAEARKTLKDYIIKENGHYEDKVIIKLFIESKGANIKYGYKDRRTQEAEIFILDEAR